jgi:predicted nucleic acid-binding protein
MALICDTGAVYALYDADDMHHGAATALLGVETGPLFLPVLLLAEIDYLLTTRLGAAAGIDFLESIEQGAFTVIPLLIEDVARCREIMVQYRDLKVGLADATVVVTAERLKIQRVFTFDQRHFRALQPRGLGSFIILPADRG